MLGPIPGNRTLQLAGLAGDRLANDLLSRGGRVAYEASRGQLAGMLEGALVEQVEEGYVTRAQNTAFVARVMGRIDGILGWDSRQLSMNRPIGENLSIIGRSLRILSDADIKRALLVMHEELVNYMTPAVLRNKVGREASADPWRARIHEPVARCVRNAPTVTASVLCVAGNLYPKNILMINIGTAVVAEASRTALEAMAPGNDVRFRACRSAEYLTCMGVTTRGAPAGCRPATFTVPPAPPEVTACVLRSVRNGIMEIAPPAVEATIAEHAPRAQVARISTIALAALQTCLPGKSSADEFTTCFDRAVIAAGGEIVESRVLAEAPVLAAFPTAAGRQRVVAAAQVVFRTCAQRQASAGRRRDRILIVDPCVARVTNHAARLVIEETFRRTDAAALPAATRALNRCWNDGDTAAEANSCVRTAILAFARDSGERQMAGRVPAGILSVDPGFTNRHLDALGACLREQLPRDIIGGADISSATDGCARKLKLDVAKAVARAEVARTLDGQMPAADLEALLVSQVDGAFMACLGEDPDDATIARCEGNLRHDVGVRAGELLVPTAIRDYVRGQGGVGAVGTTDEALDGMIQGLIARNTACLGENRARINEALDQCFLATINAAVGDVGVLQVRRELERLRGVAPALDAAAQETRTRELLAACMAEVPAGAPLTATLARINPCGERVTGEMRRQVLSQVITLTGDPLDGIFAAYEECRSRRRRDCDTVMQRQVQNFMRPFRELMEQSASSDCQPAGGLQLDVFDLATAGVISLIRESEGRSAEARAEVRALVAQFAELAAGQNPRSRDEIIADESYDPMLRNLARGMLSEAMSGSEAMGITPAMRRSLLADDLIEEVFTPAVLREIRSAAVSVVQQVGSGAASISLEAQAMQMAVTRALLDSDRVRTIVLQGQIDGELRRLGPLWLIRPIAGIIGMDTNWERVRQTREGRATEEWIMANVVTPMVEGRVKGAQAQELQREAARRMQEAMRRRGRR
jgi:hypothetical protein